MGRTSRRDLVKGKKKEENKFRKSGYLYKTFTGETGRVEK